MKRKIQKQMKENRGITLIALVVTIVVLLILSGITISTLFGDNGIINAAKKSSEDTEKIQDDTKKELQDLANDLKEGLDNSLGKGKLVPITVRYRVYTDETSTDLVPIPGGFCVANDISSDANTIASGLVISSIAEDDLDNTKHGNQFVWVPVSDEQLSTIYGTDSSGKKWGKLYNFTTTGKTNRNWTETSGVMSITTVEYRGNGLEPYIHKFNNGNYYDLGSTELNILGCSTEDEFETELQNTFNDMIESVKKYKGFYIGRYETGNLEANKYNVPVVQKDNSKLENGNWYYIYKTSKNISNENRNITTSMIFGCQWDRTIDWIASTNTSGYSLLTNSSSWGNSGSKQPSGANSIWQKNHIFDLVGNKSEWTVETGDCFGRVVRGYGSACNRSSLSAYHDGDGSRSSLYINP